MLSRVRLKKLKSLAASPLAAFFVIFKPKKLINNFKELLVFLVNDIYTDLILFLPFKLGIHAKASFSQTPLLALYDIYEGNASNLGIQALFPKNG